MKMRGDTIPGLVFVLLGGLSLAYVFTQPKLIIFGESATGRLGPGFFPLLCAALLILFGIALVIRGISQNGKVDFFQMTPEKKKNFKTMALLIGSCALFIAAWKLTNQFIVCLFVYSIVVNLLLKRSWKYTIIFAVVITGFVYAMFCLGFSLTFRV
jgi:hypothetical protein